MLVTHVVIDEAVALPPSLLERMYRMADNRTKRGKARGMSRVHDADSSETLGDAMAAQVWPLVFVGGKTVTGTKTWFNGDINNYQIDFNDGSGLLIKGKFDVLVRQPGEAMPIAPDEPEEAAPLELVPPDNAVTVGDRDRKGEDVDPPEHPTEMEDRLRGGGE